MLPLCALFSLQLYLKILYKKEIPSEVSIFLQGGGGGGAVIVMTSKVFLKSCQNGVGKSPNLLTNKFSHEG